MSFGVVSRAIVGGKRDPLRPKYTLGTYYGHFVVVLLVLPFSAMKLVFLCTLPGSY